MIETIVSAYSKRPATNWVITALKRRRARMQIVNICRTQSREEIDERTNISQHLNFGERDVCPHTWHGDMFFGKVHKTCRNGNGLDSKTNREKSWVACLENMELFFFYSPRVFETFAAANGRTHTNTSFVAFREQFCAMKLWITSFVMCTRLKVLCWKFS